MKIPRPKPPETAFKRKRSPPPQATKLLIASLSAGLLFMALLAIVFVPRYLENANPNPIATLTLELSSGSGGTRVVVTSAAYNLNVSLFNATLTRDNVSAGSLPAGLAGTAGQLNFTDANHDGLLDLGDYFTVGAGLQGVYRLVVWQTNVNQRVGFLSWTGP